MEQISKDMVKKNTELSDHTKLNNLEKELARVIKQLDNLIDLIADGLKSDTTKEKILTLESRKVELSAEIAEEKLNVSITLTEEMVLFLA